MTHKLAVLFIVLIFLANPDARPQSENSPAPDNEQIYTWDRFSVSLGAFLSSMSSDMQIGSSQLGLGVNINLENALGIRTNSFVLKGEAEYNFGKKRKSSLRIGYVGIDRKATKTLESEIEFGDQVYQKGVYVTSTFYFGIIRAVYDYSFFKDDRINLAATGGFYVMPISFSIRFLDYQQAAFVAPLPVLGIRSSFQITPKWMIKQSAELFYLQLSNIKGSVSDINFMLDYRPFTHAGFGMGLNTFRLNLEAKENIKFLGDTEAMVRTGFTGLLFYGRYFF